MLEKMLEYDTQTYHLFVYLRTAHDLVVREKLCEAMLEFGKDDISPQSDCRDWTKTTESQPPAPVIYKVTWGPNEPREKKGTPHKQRLVTTEHLHTHLF